MGWSSQAVIARLVIVEGTDDGVFIYGGPAALGNLISSDTAVAGTDAYGNAFVAGQTTYTSSGGIFYACSVQAAAVTFWTAAAAGGPWTSGASLHGDSAGDMYVNAVTTLGFMAGQITAGLVSTVPLGSSIGPGATPETWTNLNLQHGWTKNASSGLVTGARMAALPFGVGSNWVALELNIVAGTIANGTVVTDLGSPNYAPAQTVSQPVASSNQATGQSPHIVIAAGATAVAIEGAANAGVIITGTIIFPLD